MALQSKKRQAGETGEHRDEVTGALNGKSSNGHAAKSATSNAGGSNGNERHSGGFGKLLANTKKSSALQGSESKSEGKEGSPQKTSGLSVLKIGSKSRKSVSSSKSSSSSGKNTTTATSDSEGPLGTTNHHHHSHSYNHSRSHSNTGSQSYDVSANNRPRADSRLNGVHGQRTTNHTAETSNVIGKHKAEAKAHIRKVSDGKVEVDRRSVTASSDSAGTSVKQQLKPPPPLPPRRRSDDDGRSAKRRHTCELQRLGAALEHGLLAPDESERLLVIGSSKQQIGPAPGGTTVIKEFGDALSKSSKFGGSGYGRGETPLTLKRIHLKESAPFDVSSAKAMGEGLALAGVVELSWEIACSLDPEAVVALFDALSQSNALEKLFVNYGSRQAASNEPPALARVVAACKSLRVVRLHVSEDSKDSTLRLLLESVVEGVEGNQHVEKLVIKGHAVDDGGDVDAITERIATIAQRDGSSLVCVRWELHWGPAVDSDVALRRALQANRRLIQAETAKQLEASKQRLRSERRNSTPPRRAPKVGFYTGM